ncbi:hypothetical protein QQ045_005218 [Rhodiola kirilowii]
MASSLKIATILLISMIVAQPFAAQAAVTCVTVASTMRPCIPYLVNGGAVPPACCGGVKSLMSAAETPKDRQNTCTCLKFAADNLKGISPNNAAGLPSACGVSIPYPIGPNTDCTTVK